MSFKIAILIIAIFLNSVLGLLAYFHNRKSKTNWFFSAMVFAIVSWCIALFLESEPLPIYLNNFFLKLDFASGILFSYFFLQFIRNFPQEKREIHIIREIGILLPSLLLFISSFTNAIIQKALFLNGEVDLTMGMLFYGYAAVLLINILTAAFLLFKNYKSTKDVEKKQIGFVIIGLLSTTLIAIITNLILPRIINVSTDIVRIGIYSTIIFTIFTTYAIFKHHLFNIKIVSIEMITGAMWLVLLTQAVTSINMKEGFLRGILFIVFTIFSYLLIRAVLHEERHARQQYEMIATVSHQLRTPLTPVVGMASMIVEGDYDGNPKEKKDAEIKILFAAKRLSDVINDFLEIFELEGERKFDKKPVNIRSVLEESIGAVKENYKAKRLTLKFKNPKKITPIIIGEKELLVQAITNLLDNAEKYTKQGGTTVSLKEDKNTYNIQVTDTGLGIDEESKARLFEKFYRSKEAKLLRPDGSGLGLAIAKRIIESHGGKITVSSEGLFKGTTFTITFPKDKK